jgi:hypothetical protein
MPATHLAHHRASLLLTQDRDDLLFREPRLPHPSVPSSWAGLYLFLEEFQGVTSALPNQAVLRIIVEPARPVRGQIPIPGPTKWVATPGD